MIFTNALECARPRAQRWPNAVGHPISNHSSPRSNVAAPEDGRTPSDRHHLPLTRAVKALRARGGRINEELQNAVADVGGDRGPDRRLKGSAAFERVSAARVSLDER